MAGVPDPKPVKTARRPRRVVDPGACKRLLLLYRACAACGEPASNAHHVVQKGSPHFGDDVEGNLLPICGTGTARCHGAAHGSPYVVTRPVFSWGSVAAVGQEVVERRDAEWVARRLGAAIVGRPDILVYVLGKLGDVPGREYLHRVYHMEVV